MPRAGRDEDRIARADRLHLAPCFPRNFILHHWVFFEVERRTATLLQRERRRHACPYRFAQFMHHKRIMM